MLFVQFKKHNSSFTYIGGYKLLTRSCEGPLGQQVKQPISK